ncbi:hypothetical protein [Vibrio paucivorans]
MANAIVVGPYGGLINDLFNFTMLCITIFRLNKQQKLSIQIN